MTKARDSKSNTPLQQTKTIVPTKKYIVECLGYGEIDIKLVDTNKKIQSYKIEA